MTRIRGYDERVPLDRARSRPLGLALLLAAAACGPEPAVLPPRGIYRVETVLLDNTCDPRFDREHPDEDLVNVTPEAVAVPIVGSPSVNSECENCVILFSHEHWVVERDPDTGHYLRQGDWFTYRGCEHRKTIDAQITGDDSLRAVVTEDWREGDACPWTGVAPSGCTVVREYTYTLVEPCDDCDPHRRDD